jgi:hypothetical protein
MYLAKQILLQFYPCLDHLFEVKIKLAGFVEQVFFARSSKA